MSEFDKIVNIEDEIRVATKKRIDNLLNRLDLFLKVQPFPSFDKIHKPTQSKNQDGQCGRFHEKGQ